MNFGKIITWFIFVICIYFIVKVYQEFRERPLSEKVNVKVEKKYCRSNDHETRIIVTYLGNKYNVRSSKELCGNIEIGQTLELYYSEKLDKIYENTNKIYVLLFTSFIPLILMILYIKFKQ